MSMNLRTKGKIGVSLRVDGWRVGRESDHFRCRRVCFPATRSERISQTAKFYPYKHPVLKATKQETVLLAAKSLVDAIKSQSTSPIFKNKNGTGEVLQ